MKLRITLLTFVLALSFSFQAMADYSYLHKMRGNPWEYDVGPQKDSEILKVMMEIPNYRTLGRKIMGAFGERTEERFRWEWGPVFYRGRLGSNQVKVLLIGQEGGQDEGFAKRAFTGGTGQQMQHFLNYMGVTHSYLFLNTYIYSIRSQYQDKEVHTKGPKIGEPKKPNCFEGDVWLAQTNSSPIAQHRNKLFDTVLEQNPDLRLVIAVGGSAKDSVKTWVMSHGGTCDKSRDVSKCTAEVLGPNVQLIGVMHPGMAAKGDTEEEKAANRKTLEIDFQKAADRAALLVAQNSKWLPLDPGASRPDVVVKQKDQKGNVVKAGFKTFFEYGGDPVPYRDFAFGNMWSLGRNSTRTNRTTDQRSIIPYSDDGKYSNSRKYSVSWPSLPAGSKFKDSGYTFIEGDLSYEPSKANINAYDKGPGKEWAKLLMGGEKGLHWPDFSALGAISHPSFGHGPIYRGRLDEARILILADQQSHDDMLRGRALLGDGGQKIQHFLANMGITRSYAIIRTLPVDTLGVDYEKVEDIASHVQVRKVRKAILEKILSQGNTHLILTFGNHAREALRGFNAQNIPVFNLKRSNSKSAAKDWTNQLKKVLKVDYKRDNPNLQRAFAYTTKDWENTRLEINRNDLPFGTVRWFGTSGSMATRSQKDRRPKKTKEGKLVDNYKPGDYYRFTMPLWSKKEKAAALSEEEYTALSNDGWLDKTPREERRVDSIRAKLAKERENEDK